jgi:hypothetical protein
MSTIFIDDDYKCHVSDDGTMTPVETDFFDGKCSAFIEGYRYVPSGCTWTRSDGEVFRGEMVAPWQDIRELRLAQLEYENEQLEKSVHEQQATTDDMILMMAELIGG